MYPQSSVWFNSSTYHLHWNRLQLLKSEGKLKVLMFNGGYGCREQNSAHWGWLILYGKRYKIKWSAYQDQLLWKKHMNIFFFSLDRQALNPETLECSALSFKVMNTQNPDNSVIHQGEILLICTKCMGRLNGSISCDLSRILCLVNLFI